MVGKERGFRGDEGSRGERRTKKVNVLPEGGNRSRLEGHALPLVRFLMLLCNK